MGKLSENLPAIGVGLLCVVIPGWALLLYPKVQEKVPAAFEGATPHVTLGISLVAIVVCCFGIPYARRKKIKMSKEAQEILQYVASTDYHTVTSTMAMGQVSLYICSRNRTFCDGKDANISLDYSEALNELVDLGFLETTNKQVYKLTKPGRDYGKRLPTPK